MSLPRFFCGPRHFSWIDTSLTFLYTALHILIWELAAFVVLENIISIPERCLDNHPIPAKHSNAFLSVGNAPISAITNANQPNAGLAPPNDPFAKS